MFLISMEWFNMIFYVFESIIFNIFSSNLNLNIFKTITNNYNIVQF